MQHVELMCWKSVLLFFSIPPFVHVQSLYFSFSHLSSSSLSLSLSPYLALPPPRWTLAS